MPPKPKFTALTDDLYEYMAAHRSPDGAVVQELRDETAALGDSSVMQIAPDQATFLRILVAAIGARRAGPEHRPDRDGGRSQREQQQAGPDDFEDERRGPGEQERGEEEKPTDRADVRRSRVASQARRL